MKLNKQRQIKRGDIYFVQNDSSQSKRPHEQADDRPAIIIQNDVGNLHSPTVIVAYLTAKSKNRMPTHVHTCATHKPSIIMFEQLETISKERLINFICSLSEDEMKEVDKALAISVGLSKPRRRKNA